MDKQLLERVSIGIQVLGYGLFIHSFFISRGTYNRYLLGDTNWQYLNEYNDLIFRDGQILYLIMCLVVPIFLRWMLTGNFHIIPLTRNYLKELNKPMRDKSEKG